MQPTYVVLHQATWHAAWLYGVHRTCAETATVTRGTIHMTTKQRYKSRHFILSHIRRVHSCLAVTYHLHIWQNDQDLLRTTATVGAWNGYRNKNTESWPRRRQFSRRSCLESNPLFIVYSRSFAGCSLFHSRISVNGTAPCVINRVQLNWSERR